MNAESWKIGAEISLHTSFGIDPRKKRIRPDYAFSSINSGGAQSSDEYTVGCLQKLAYDGCEVCYGAQACECRYT